MPESKFDISRHSYEEVSNFLACGDARGVMWLARHPEDLPRASGRLQGREVTEVALKVEGQGIDGGFATDFETRLADLQAP